MTGKQTPFAGLPSRWSLLMGNAVTFIVLFTIVTTFDGFAARAAIRPNFVCSRLV